MLLHELVQEPCLQATFRAVWVAETTFGNLSGETERERHWTSRCEPNSVSWQATPAGKHSIVVTEVD